MVAIGTRLGPYEVLSPLGAGGMGEVYRARDTRLDRDVAIKVLPESLARDKERILRFEREAKLLATLNHTHIAAIYGFEESDGKRFLVMEYVPGLTLAQRLRRGPLPMDEALQVAVQMARALESAHEKGVTHRDIKPGNVMITPEGNVKVLDFGLARIDEAVAPGFTSAESPNSPTLTWAAHSPTAPGMIMGTVGYMSPEQARGKPVDKRTDIFSFGCVLYEMLAGRSAFGSETVSDSIAAVLHREPDLSKLPTDVPWAARRVLRRCLAKDRTDRWHDIADARIELQAGDSEPNLTHSPKGRLQRRFGLLAAAVALAGLAVLAWVWPHDTPKAVVARFALEKTQMTADAFLTLALSPDGRHLVYPYSDMDRRNGLRVRSFDDLQSKPLLEANAAWAPFFSPDGGRIGFYWRGWLNIANLVGGQIRPVVMVDQGGFAGATWMPDDTIIFASSNNRFGRVSSAGGAIEYLEVKGLSEGEFVISPWVLPGGHAILCGVGTGSSFGIGVYELAGRTLKRLADSGFNPTYVQGGYVLYQDGPTGPLTALPFDAKRCAAKGPAFPVISDLGNRVGYQVRMFAASDNGTLAYVPKTSLLERGALLWVDREGNQTPIVEVDRVLDLPRLSHDGRRIAFRAPAPNCDVWMHDLDRGLTARLTYEGDNHGIAWFADDSRLAFARLVAPQLWSVLALRIGATDAEPLTDPVFVRAYLTSLSPDGRYALVNSTRSAGTDVYLADFAQKTATPLLDSRFQERNATFSPDGGYVAYVSDESGRDEIYVRPFPTLSTRDQFSVDGGTDPVWSPNGKELFFRIGRKMMTVEVTTDPVLKPGRPQVLFETDLSPPGSGLPGYDVSPDGQRFVMWRQRTDEGGASIHVVLNLLEEIQALDPRNTR